MQGLLFCFKEKEKKLLNIFCFNYRSIICVSDRPLESCTIRIISVETSTVIPSCSLTKGKDEIKMI